MALYTEDFSCSGADFRVASEVNERTGEPMFKQSVFVNGEYVGTTEMRFSDSVQWVKDHFYRWLS